MKRILLGLLVSVVLYLSITYYVSIRDSKASIVEAVESIRSNHSVQVVVHEQYFNNGAFIYYLKNMNEGSPVISVEYVKSTLNGKWKWVYGGSHSSSKLSLMPDPNDHNRFISAQYLPVVEQKEHRIPHPVLYGGISDPRVTRLVVRDYITELERQVSIITVTE